MECRDWLKTLWSASYKGVPFYFESDEEEGGRGLVVHQFPNRDQPFVEDLGEEARYYSGAAYVHGDDADAQAAAFTAMLVTRGAGTLMVPISGAVSVHLQTFRRSHKKDQLGFVAFDVKFVRAGAASAFVSLPALANIAFGAVEAFALLLAPAFARAVRLRGHPDHVIAGASDGVASAAAALDNLRRARTVAPATSAKLRDTLAGIVADAPAVISAETDSAAAEVADLAAKLVTATRDLADAMPPETAAAAMIEIADIFAQAPPAPPALAPSDALASDNAAAAARLARLAALSGFADAALRRSYASRPEGVTARAAVSERFEIELAAASGAEHAELYVAIQDLRGRVCDYLSRLINDLAPVITVEAAAQLPSLFWAYRLYRDPLRAREIVARNDVRHPSFVPATFQALAR